MNKLGERIRTLREQCGLSKAELARRVGVSDVTISYWENGTIRRVGHSRLEPLSRALRCSIQHLLGQEKTASDSEARETLPLYALTFLPESIKKRSVPLAYMPATLFDLSRLAPRDYLLVPSAGDHFDYCHEGSFLLARHCRSFDGEGLYLLERKGRLVIRRVRQQLQKGLELFSEESETAPLECCQRDELEFHARIATIWAPRSVS